MSDRFTIAHLSDLHCGSPHFVPSLLDRALVEINELEPDLVIVSGDLTSDGLRGEYELARDVPGPDRRASGMIVIPGNHDSRNVGYVHFEELFGERRSELHTDGVSIVAVDSHRARPRPRRRSAAARYPWIEERFALPTRPTCASSSCTTTCCRSPAPAASATSCTTPATRSSACSAPTCTWCCPATSTCRTPGGWRTCSSSTPAPSRPPRLRGKTKPCYNVIEASPERVDVLPQVPVPRAATRSSRSTRARYEYEKDQSLLGETAHG